MTIWGFRALPEEARFTQTKDEHGGPIVMRPPGRTRSVPKIAWQKPRLGSQSKNIAESLPTQQ